jgi:uncharacterized protein
MNKLNHSWQKWLQSVKSGCIAIAFVLLTWVAWGQAATATGVYEIPMVAPGSAPWVIDQGEVLSRATQGTLNKQLETLASSTDAEIRFVTIRWLDYGVTIDDFAQELFKQWFPTEAEQSHQAVLVLDTKTNTTAMVTAADLAEVLPNDIATSVAKETALFQIRKGSYNQGLLDAGNRLEAVVSGEPDPGAPVIEVQEVESTFKSAEETDGKTAAIIVVVLLILATVIPMVTYYWYVTQ